jgi:peptidoglycan glycosyltransferase
VEADPEPKRRAARPLVRAALWSLPVVLGVVAILLVARARGEADLAQAAQLLLERLPAEARPLLERHRDSRRFGARARAGLAVTAALEGASASDDFPPAALAFFQPRALMDAALRRGDFEASGRLARFASEHGDPGAAAYEAAALVEGGDDRAAAAMLAEFPGIAASPGLGGRIARVLEAHGAGATLTVTDRRGRLAGFLDASGAFHAEPGGAADWIPSPALAAAKAGERKGGVRLSTDFDLSAIALEALGAERGSIVLVDLATGEVRAAVTDARTRAASGGTPSFEQAREPASIAKIVTTAAALRAGHDADGEVRGMVCNGSHHYRGGILWCSTPGGPLTGGLKQAFAISCNIAFANLAVELGWPAMLDELHRWGFDRPRDEWPGAGRVLKTEGTERELASLGVGLDYTEITPLHAALLGSVLASGEMAEPALVAADDGVLGLSPRPVTHLRPRRILEPAWVPLMQKALEGVVEEGGTAEGVAPESFPVVMKTGTASTPGLGYHVNYVGAGPLPHPKIAFAVRVTNQPTSQRVRDSAQDVLANLLEALGRRHW